MLSQASLVFAELVRLPEKAELKQELLSLGMVYLQIDPDKIMIFFPSGKEIDTATLQQKVRAAVMVNSVYNLGHPETFKQECAFSYTFQLHSEEIFQALCKKYKVQAQK
jgi:hypothetical protein